MIRAKICGVYTKGFDDLERLAPKPDDDFAYELNVELCPTVRKGVNTFTTIVCTPKWMQRQLVKGEPLSGRHHLIVSRHDLGSLMAFLERFVAEVEVERWGDLITWMDRIAWCRDEYPDEASHHA